MTVNDNIIETSQGSIADDEEFCRLVKRWRHASQSAAAPHKWRELVAYIDSRAPAAPVAQLAPDGWKPIETAPHTGHLLLGCFNSMGKWHTMRGQWFTKAEIDQDWEETDGFEEGWYETAEEPDCPNCWAINPTHWAAIPPAPQQEGSEAGNGCGRV